MKFHSGLVFHVFNQGNNRNPIFFEEENYLYFLRKTRKYILPFADLICYCLMPNHFHFLLVPNDSASEPGTILKPGSKFTEDKNEGLYQEKLSQNFGIFLSSYAQAINKKYHRSGSLFRAKTKVKNGRIDQVITIDGRNRHLFFRPDNDYALQCFHYIHENPVKANLVKVATDWPYSSARDYAEMRKYSLCNLEFGRIILEGR